MIIPISRYSKFKSGDEVILIKDVYKNHAVFCKGHKFKILKKIKGYSLYILIDIDGNKLKTSKGDFSLTVNYKTAKKEWDDFHLKNHFKDFMSKTDWNHKGINCPNLDYTYEDRDIYLICKLKRKFNKSCNPKLKCANYLDKITDKKILKYIRKSKINRIVES